MKILGFDLGRRITEQAISVEVTDVSPVKKAISYSDLFAHGMPMETFMRQVTRPYENIATVYKAIKALCDNVPQARLKFYNKATEEEVEDERLRILFENPNSRQSQADFIQEWVGYYALYGEGFIKTITGVAQVAGIANLPANLINLDPSKINEIVDHSRGMLTGWRYFTTIFKPEEVIHTKDFNPYNRFRGLSPVKVIADEMEIDQASLTFNSAFFKNNATAGMILSTENNLSKEQKDQLRAALKARHAGADNAFNTLILEKGLEPKDAGHSTHKEMEFIEQKKLMREEILGIWRTPKALFNITDDLNYATFMGQMRVFWIYGLMPIMRKFEDSANKYIVAPYNPNLYVAFDYSNTPAFQEDFKERVATAQILTGMGFTPNEANEKLNLGFEATDWRNYWWMAFGLTPVNDANVDQQVNPPEPAPIAGQPDDQEQEAATAEAGKSINPQLEAKKQIYMKIFLKGQGQIENLMERKVSRYMMELRARILKLSGEDLRNLMLSWDEQDKNLTKLMKPVMLEGIRRGVEIGQMVLARKKTLNEDAFESRINSYLQLRVDKLTGINDTIKDRLQGKLRDVLTEQIEQGASMQMQVDAMREAVRGFFNLTANRSRLIARTESGGAVNGGSMLYYQNEGVEKKQWVTAHDENVRESHRACEAQGAIGMDRSFVNGLQYPSDQANGDAGEVCNCRCSLLPIVD